VTTSFFCYTAFDFLPRSFCFYDHLLFYRANKKGRSKPSGSLLPSLRTESALPVLPPPEKLGKVILSLLPENIIHPFGIFCKLVFIVLTQINWKRKKFVSKMTPCKASGYAGLQTRRKISCQKQPVFKNIGPNYSGFHRNGHSGGAILRRHPAPITITDQITEGAAPTGFLTVMGIMAR